MPGVLFRKEHFAAIEACGLVLDRQPESPSPSMASPFACTGRNG